MGARRRVLRPGVLARARVGGDRRVVALVCAALAAVLLLDAGPTVALAPGVRLALLVIFLCPVFVAFLGVVALSCLSLTAYSAGGP